MIKADLKQIWGSYCDTDKLVDDMMSLLTKYRHDNTEHGVCSMLDTYFTNKRNLIDLFIKSSGYIGDMRICLDVELERHGNASEVFNFIENFPHKVDARQLFIKYVDDNGKTLADYQVTGIKRFKARNLLYGDIAERLVDNKEAKRKFMHDGSTKASHMALDEFCQRTFTFSTNHQSVLQTETAENLTQYEINATFVGGMKTSRAFNRFCTAYGVDKLPEYNRLFAKYSDMVSGLKRKVKFYISLNPLDYLTMSFGNSWSSCHTIDKENSRNMPSSYQGMHCGGTVSYMLDKTSFITFVHEHAMKHYEDGKLYRNMFHYGNDVLIQGRVYPQGNDGATDLYREFRKIVQDEFSELLGLKENVWIRRNRSCGENTDTYGVHYADYLHFDGCNASYPSEMPHVARNIVDIGHKRICPNCGKEVSNREDGGYLTHENCDRVDRDEDDEWF